MNSWRLIYRSLIYHRQIHFAVMLGVMAATAVLTGALLVGDSVRGSLQDLAISRLGKIDTILFADRFFDQNLVDQFDNSPEFLQQYDSALPVVLMQGTLEHQYKVESDSENNEEEEKEITRRAGSVAVLGIDDSFWKLGEVTGFDGSSLTEDEIVINQTLAEQLNAKVGDQITLRLPIGNEVPADSPLGRKKDRSQSVPRLTVKAVIAATGLGRFGLHPSQQLPLNAYLSTARLQSALDQKDKINAIFFATKQQQNYVKDSETIIRDSFQPKLADFGFQWQRVKRTFQAADLQPTQTIFDYYQLTSQRMMFSPAAEDVIVETLGKSQVIPVYTYLANSIGKINFEKPKEKTVDEPNDESEDEEAIAIPYSTVTALDFDKLTFPLLDIQGVAIGAIDDDEVVINSWLADKLKVKVGTDIYLTYFNSESTHGVAEEITTSFKVAAITPLTQPSDPFTRRESATFDQPPTAANDDQYTPVVEGLTDKDSIEDWDPPFPYYSQRVKPRDEEYWDEHRTTPKVFLSLSAGQNLWKSRFGSVTSFRLPVDQELQEEQQNQLQQNLISKLEAALQQNQQKLGFQILTVKRDALQAATGTTPFNVLFLGFSFFIIAAALMLVSLLFKLGVEQRATEIGTLQALGLPSNLTARLLMFEGLIVAIFGSLAGTIAGIGYAWLMLVGLRSWWLAAVVTPFLFLKLDNPLTLMIGFISGSLISMVTIYVAIRGLKTISIRSLMSGLTEVSQLQQSKTTATVSWLAMGMIVIAFISSIAATQLAGEAQAGAFFAAGAAVLTALLSMINRSLKVSSTQGKLTGSFSLSQLAKSNAARNPGRSTLTIGLMAAACFLIIAISSFRLSPSEQGAGGMDLIAESSQPIYHDINTPEGRYDLSFDTDDEILMKQTKLLSLRVQPGDDASCLNLYQSNSPRVLGVSPEMIAYYDQQKVIPFSWAGSSASDEQARANPWHAFEHNADGIEEPIPVVLDKNTAMYALHLYGGIGEVFTTTDDDDRTTKYQVAGLLSNSIFQGNLLISEENFKQRFPEVSGHRYFLIKSPTGQSEEISELLEDRLSNVGFDTISATEKLTSLLAVQNTYLSTFQSLGALGLLLGTFGLATVQLRSVFERRGELALMRAIGYQNGQLSWLVLWENSLLLITGLVTGTIAALVAVLPHMILGGASIPLFTLFVMILVIALVGLATGMISVRAILKTPLLSALKNIG